MATTLEAIDDLLREIRNQGNVPVTAVTDRVLDIRNLYVEENKPALVA